MTPKKPARRKKARSILPDPEIGGQYAVCRGCIKRMGIEGRCLTYNRDFHQTISNDDHRKIRVLVVREVRHAK